MANNEVFADRIIEDSSLKACPFCGKKAVLVHKVVARGRRYKKPEDTNKEVYETYTTVMGKLCYSWLRRAYAISCETSNCFCKTTQPIFKNKDDAINAWNKRVDAE